MVSWTVRYSFRYFNLWLLAQPAITSSGQICPYPTIRTAAATGGLLCFPPVLILSYAKSLQRVNCSRIFVGWCALGFIFLGWNSVDLYLSYCVTWRIPSTIIQAVQPVSWFCYTYRYYGDMSGWHSIWWCAQKTNLDIPWGWSLGKWATTIVLGIFVLMVFLGSFVGEYHILLGIR